jgi:TPR repeat protein
MGIETNEKKSFEWMLRSAQQGDSDALYEIGNYYRDGIGTSIDYLKAIKWWMKAAADSNVNAIKVLQCKRCPCTMPNPIGSSIWSHHIHVVDDDDDDTKQWLDKRAMHFDFGRRVGHRNTRDQKIHSLLIDYDGVNGAVYPARLNSIL